MNGEHRDRQDLSVLFVLTSHARKGSTGEPTGFYLGEVTHPLAELDAAGIPVEFASIQAVNRPSTGSISMTKSTPGIGAMPRSETHCATRSGSATSTRRNMRRSSLPAVMAQCGIFPATPTWRR